MDASKPAPGRLKRWAALALLALVLAAVAAAVATTLGAPAHPRRSAALAGGVLRPGRGSILSRLPAELAAGSAESPQGPYRLGEVLAGFRSGVSPARRLAIEHAAGATSARRLGRPVKPAGHGRTTAQEYPAPMELRVPDTQVFAAIRRLKRFAEVAYAEPNYLQVASATPNKPNDPEFGKQWGDENAEQPIPFQDQTEKLGAEEKGTAGADDKASFAWNVTTGSRKIVIGEVDTGVAYEHPDLAANIWSNPGGINGCAAGTHGYNVLAKTCNPIDEDGSYNGHGTHVAGIIGAVGNNGAGVAGMNWQTTILPVRWLNSAGSETSALIEALNWLVLAKQAGVNVRVVNDSDVFPGTAKSEALSKEIETLGSNNILFVSAAGNNGSNLEAAPHYPCAYDLPNEICVTASNNKDALPSWANTGEKKVQLAAPGVSIFSTLRGNSYGWLSGGSMAAPQVSGAAALILSVKEMSTAELKEDILKNVDRLPAYEKKVESGGRLNVCKALPGCSEPSPPPKEETLGKTAVGGATDTFGTERKRVNCYALPTSGSVTKLRVYLEHTTTSGQQVMKGIVYSDPSGKPENLLAVSEPLTFRSTNAAGWYELPFSASVNLSPGNYCIGVITGATEKVAGFHWGSVSGSRFYNPNAYSSGPTNPFGSATVDTEQTSLYATYLTIPVNTGLPKIAGTAQQGKTLTEERGTWANEPTNYGYNWQQCDSTGNNCTAIAGATGQTYAPVAGDVGHAIRVQETATNAKGSSSPATSAATAVVAPPAATNTSPPTITGTAQQGKTLTEVNGKWTNEPTSYSYQWQQCDGSGNNCTSVATATEQTYKPVAGDVNHTLRVVEKATNAGGSGEASSAATPVVLPAPPVSKTPPTIEGKAQQGQTLAEAHGTWENSPTGFTYHWQQCDGSGNNCTNIAAATEQTYKPVAGDVGHTIKVVERATNAGGSGEATSAATAAVLIAAPVNKTPPTIEGKAQQGQTLTEAHGTWDNSPAGYSYQWQQCDGSGNNCTNIAAATEQTYKPVAGDKGHALRVVEKATNAGGSGQAPSAPTTPVVPPAPVNNTPPTIEGKAQQGQTLTEVHGTWENSPTGFTYQWQQCNGEGTPASCTNIAAATEQAYKPAAGDVNHALRVLEKATNAGGSGEAASAATAVVLPAPPVNNTPPTIEGKAQQGQTLTEIHGNWENGPTGFAYQWQQCNGEGTPASCMNIAAATEQAYKPVAGDVGHALRVVEKATNAGGSGEATTAPTAPVSAPVPVLEQPPTIIGPAQQGQTMTEVHGKWSNNPTSYSYQWLQCNSEGTLSSCANISDATAQTYTPGPGDVGHAIRVQETAISGAGSSTPATSAPTEAVKPPSPKNSFPPTIEGKAQQGQTLTEHHGTWTNSPTGFSYQWQQCNGEGTPASCDNISGATEQTYKPAEGDLNHALRVLEKATNAGGSGEATSAPTTPVVAPAPVNKTPPTIEGKAQQGQTLTEVHGTWENNPAGFTYQWQQCNSIGEGCLPINGATKQAYEPAVGDVGQTLKVVEKATNAGGAGEATSAATATVVPPAPVNKTPPTIEGKAQQGQTLSEVHGAWENSPTGYTYQWQQCDGSGNNCISIAAATEQSYKPAEGDVNHALRVVEKATNAGGAGEATSAATTPVASLAPVNKTPPTIEGKAQQGQTLTEVHGTWENNPTGFTYQWQQCNGEGTPASCTNIAAANEQAYKPVAGDIGHGLRILEKAANAGGSGEAASAATAAVLIAAPAAKNPPTIEGKAQPGQTLTEAHGTWDNSPTGYTYQWQQCDGSGNNCTNIAAANEQSYKPAEGDVNHALRVVEKATNAAGSGEAPSAATTPVVPPAPVNKTPPTIEGKAQQGQTLTEVHGAWENNPTGYSYQWQQCNSEGTPASCANIATANEQSYKPAQGDVGHAVRVLENASNAGGSGEAASAATAAVLIAAPVAKTPPTIEGKAQQGQTLTEVHGTWENNPTGYSYQWQQCNTFGEGCLPINGAAEQTYKPLPGDVGQTLKVVEKATNAGGPGEATSAATTPVAPLAPVNKTPPTTEGKAQQGQTLTEVHGTWENSPTGYSYQWQQCDGSGNNCTNLAAATEPSYKPVEGDVNHALRVVEKATNAGGSGEATSAATAAVLIAAPAAKNPPTIAGKAQLGQTLTEAHGTWANSPTSYTYQWQQCDGSGNNCTNLAAATEQSYKPVEGDVNHALRVVEQATNAGGSGESLSAATAVVTPPPPVDETPPTITGAAQQGQTLTEHNGKWSSNPTGYAYRWLRCNTFGTSCLAIKGATEPTYNQAAGDVGHTIAVQEVASNAGGSGAPATSETTAVVLPSAAPSNTSPPTITGEARQGQTLTEHPGSWANEPTGFAYQWLRCDTSANGCVPISTAAGQTYVLVAADVNHTIEVQEEATNGLGSTTATSAATAVVVPPPPTSTSPPTIEGKAQQGQTLTEVHANWENNPTGFTYQWQQCNGEGTPASCTTIAAATEQIYKPVAGDVNHTMRVVEKATNAGGSGEAISAATTPVVPPTPVNKTPPTIEGKAQQGQTLTEVHGNWENNPTGFAYQWQQCNGEGTPASCTNISGATEQTYKPAEGDVGHALRVAEKATNAGGSSEVPSAATTAVVPPTPVNKAPPTIEGKAQQGQTLTEVHGTWENNPTGYTYKWLQCDSSGDSCANISGATSQAYVVAGSDVGHELRVQETASNAGGTSAPASSAATAVVLGAPPASSSPPTITGTAQQGQTLTEHAGSWTNSPTSFNYHWLQCDSLGNSCLPISGAPSQTYVLAGGDVGHTIRVQEEAHNAAGAGGPATSTPTAVVGGTFGTTSVGASKDSFLADRKRVNRYALSTAGSVSKLSIYLAPTTTAGQQLLEGLIYADSSNAPAALLGVSEQLTFKNTNSAGWYDLKFASPVKLAAGNYWIGVITGVTSNVAGFRYASVASSRDYNANTYASGPTNPFGAASTDAEQTSLYATYTPGS